MLQLKKSFDVRGCARSNFFKLFCLQLVLNVFKIESEIIRILFSEEKNETKKFISLTGFFRFLMLPLVNDLNFINGVYGKFSTSSKELPPITFLNGL